MRIKMIVLLIKIYKFLISFIEKIDTLTYLELRYKIFKYEYKYKEYM